MRLSAGAFSDTGRLRDGNEDALLVDERLTVFAIADGMGGHRGGEVASWTAIESLRASIAAGRSVNDAIKLANSAVLERAAGDAELAGMGTTLTVVVPAGGARLLVGHVGDSRAYMLHDGALTRITDDHSLVEELVRDGRLTPEQAEAHPQRAIITRALGVDDDVDVDLYTIEVTAGDRIVLCSDGLTTMVRDRDVERVARSEDDPQRAAEVLVDAANAAGGEDNITVVVVDVVEVDETGAPDPEALAAVAPPPMRSVPAPDVPEPVSVAPSKASLPRRVRGVLLLLIPLLVIIGIAIGSVGWYARRSYYVGLEDNRVVVYRGVPGGVLGWDPTVTRRTDLTTSDLSLVQVDQVREGTARGSLDRAEVYISRLEKSVEARTTTTTASSTSSTSSITTSTTAITTTTGPTPLPPP